MHAASNSSFEKGVLPLLLPDFFSLPNQGCLLIPLLAFIQNGEPAQVLRLSAPKPSFSFNPVVVLGWLKLDSCTEVNGSTPAPAPQPHPQLRGFGLARARGPHTLFSFAAACPSQC